jgi:hypothetical protein
MSAPRHIVPLLALLSLAFTPVARAQVNPAVGATEEQRQRRNLDATLKKSQAKAEGTTSDVSAELFAGEFEDVGPQEILGTKRRRKWVNLDLDSQFFYTSNSALTEDGDDTTMLVHTLSLSVGPEMIDSKYGEIRPRFGFRHQFFNYGLVGSPAAPGVTDFDSQALFGYVSLDTQQQWQYLFSLEYQRLLDHTPTFSSYKEFYRDWVPRVSISKTISRSETRYFTFNYQMAYHLSESPRDLTTIAIQDRIESVATISYTHSFNPQWVVQPYYRFIHNHYTHQSARDDLAQSVGTLLLYTLNEYFSFRAFVAYDTRESDLPIIPDFYKIDFGAAVHFSRKF